MRAHRLQHFIRLLAHLENVANVARQTRRIAHKEPGRFPTDKRNEGPKFRQEVVRWLQGTDTAAEMLESRGRGLDTENSADGQSQSVRRKGGKYVYIICSKNPKHKQRQG
ncbi:hypothetical protein D6D17_05871 [Aureobasidium pullulans]|nr:hypothetical protein D6D17_05871 [Aureobasidium pullulans]THX79679.1 hypothetical protein D6D04_05019 [Aureobasidium pullulans]